MIKEKGGDVMLRLDLAKTINCSMAGRVRQSRGWEHEGRKHVSRNLFVFMIEGNAEFHFNGRDFHVHPGDALLIPKRTLYTAKTEDSCEYYFLHFQGDLEICDGMPSFSYERHHFSFVLPPVQSSCVFLDEYLQTGERYTEFLSRIGGCIGNASETTHTARMLLNVEFERILIMLGGICERAYSKRRLPPTMDKILLFIRARLAGALSVHDICTHFHLSRSYLARLFKQYFQMTPTAYINNEKMHYAGELLQNTDMNISEIAEYLGYCDVFYFSRLYKRTFGVPPSRDIKR